MLPTIYSYVPRLAAPLGCVVRISDKDGIYLTFDDGPDPDFTPQLLDVLRQHQAKASFFLIGERAEKYPELVRQIFDEGHTVGQHGYEHLSAWKHSSRTILHDLDVAHRIIQEITGHPLTWIRPPFGRIRPSMLRWTRTHSQKIVLWDVMPAEYLKNMETSVITKTILRLAKPGSIIALHEGAQCAGTLLPSLNSVLPTLASRGLTFKAL